MTHDPDLRKILDSTRTELLDLSSRNRLLNTSRGQGRTSRLEIVDERSDEVFRRLVEEGKSLSFQPRREEAPVPARPRTGLDDRSSPDARDDRSSPDALADTSSPGATLPASSTDTVDQARSTDALGVERAGQPEELSADTLADRHLDGKLQTLLVSDLLQKRLLKLYYDARTYEEEQGVNILYLALGFLQWYEDPTSDRPRYAPLLLVPVALERTSATARFRLRYTEDEIATNLSLQARLKSDFGIHLPDVPERDELTPGEYFQAVAEAVRDQARWQVLADDMVLWFFSFSKFLMYRDLDPDSWPETAALGGNPLVRSLLLDGFADDPPLCDDADKVDRFLHPRQMVHVLDADSSQALVIEEARRGRNLVIQGPPGTGKSQTIANLIAAAVTENKTVLFVAEKMAALEVVERRLAQIGLEEICLELHSNKANKRAVLQTLERALGLGKPRLADIDDHCERLVRCRDRLNRHLELIHSPREPWGRTPYQILGQLVRLRAQGIRPPEFSLEGALTWSAADFQSRRDGLQDLVRYVKRIGTPGQSPWRGVRLEAILPMDGDRVQAKLAELGEPLERLRQAGRELAAAVSVESPDSLQAVGKLAQLAERLRAAPPMDRASLGTPAWSQQRERIDQLVQSGRSLAERRGALDSLVVDVAWDTDLSATRRHLAAHGRSWFRWLHRGYREAQATLRGILAGPPPKPLDQRLRLVDQLIAAQKLRRELLGDSADALGRQAFGTFWNGESSDWDALESICRWETEMRQAGCDPRFRQLLAALPELPEVESPLERIRGNFAGTLEQWKSVCETLRLDGETAFGVGDLAAVPWSELLSRLEAWQSSPESLSDWVACHTRCERLERLGLRELVGEISDGSTAADEAVSRFEFACHEAWIRDVFEREPELSTFRGETHEQVLEEFRRLDRQRIDLARQEVALAHYRRLPTARTNLGELGVVRREIQKKRRHLPIRQLLAQAGQAVQAIKPVFMMSPISVAQYLEPGLLEFDLLLIDEASQVQPVDALGAVARAKQVVVVGDSRQLPPTRFFSRMLGDAEAGDEDDLQAADMESILGLCCARNVPQRMLSWHYRSRHHSLIAVSNHEFYDNRLYVIPSPGEPAAGQGLVFQHVAEGVFDRGGSATNRIEARRVALAVMDHARRCPDRSLGVGAFSVAQRDAILDELEQLRREDPSLEPFFATSAAEPFFVKNLENIQGDERDVILISVGYGRDADGYMAMNFGPLSGEGGERRLNVLITRARDCCTVYSSIRAQDIDLNRARSRGAQALKTFLAYAETGLLDTGQISGRDHDSEFERQVAKAVASLGYETHPQVGVAGFFIDLALVDPEQPGRYLLGIECDGANYHRARWARDRDRLRQAVLESRGWRIHRIWSTDWFHRPEDELRRLAQAIDQARMEGNPGGRDSGQHRPSPAAEQPTILRSIEPEEDDEDVDDAGANGPALARVSQPYVLASFRVQANQQIHQLSTRQLAQVVAKIVDVEGPIHREEVARRVAQLWGLQRTGSRIRDSVNLALEVLAKRDIERIDKEFFTVANRDDIPVRDRAEVPSPTLRKPEMLPPAEIRQALIAIALDFLGVAGDEAIVETARRLGFKSTSTQLKQIIERELAGLLKRGHLVERNGKLYAARTDAGSLPAGGVHPRW